jgi:hypothetical protein
MENLAASSQEAEEPENPQLFFQFKRKYMHYKKRLYCARFGGIPMIVTVGHLISTATILIYNEALKGMNKEHRNG